MKEKGKLKYFGHIPSRLDVGMVYEILDIENHRYK